MLKGPIISTLIQVLGKVIMVGISLITTSVLTRKLGPGQYGAFTLVGSVFILLDSMADFGTKIIGVRESSNTDSDGKKKIFVQLVYLRLMTTLLAFGVGVALIYNWSGFDQIRTESLIALSMMWFTSLAGSLEIIFQTKMRLDLKVIVDIFFPLLFLFILLFGFGGEVTLYWVFLFYLIARILSLGIGLGLVARFLKLKIVWQKIEWGFIRKLLIESWPMGIYLIVFASYDRAVDSMMIERYLGIKEVAWYGLAYKIYSNLVQPSYFFVASIFPMLSSKMEGKRKLFMRSLVLMTVGVVVVIPMIYMMAPWIINVLAGSGYELSVGVLRILLIALFFAYIEHLVGFALISKGGQKELLGFGLAALVFNIGANFWAIPRFGIMGAAWVTAGTEGIACGLMAWQLWKQSRK